ncbi:MULTISPECIES: uroporphyrinogen-III C-methyltransferase [Limnobacter]|uniref:uroporphyrinogen-III C-methyltransferase n=1 Tax=Limnobacter litoralis TaxID=481366 RepID=A0ABQ5YNL9_9BURK|nr:MULTISPECIES: uroporphyrinogen-III C-methyltransferase [Limnobacter]GLR26198.1 uroporphyrin-III C-methyltransferase [Limnobacter litoralis]
MGRVVLIGAGPGAEDLITVRGLRLLEQADCVFHDALVSPSLLLHARPDAKIVAVGKRCGKQSTAQTFINKQLVLAAQQHALVVRLKGGDPMVFGRADEELNALRDAGHEVQVVPGVTAALAAASSLQASLTLRGVARSLTLTTPSVGVGEIPGTELFTGTENDTVAVYMGLRQAGPWAAALLEKGRNPATPVILCESVSLPSEKFTPLTLKQLPRFSSEQLTDGPCLILIGQALAQAKVRLELGSTPDHIELNGHRAA